VNNWTVLRAGPMRDETPCQKAATQVAIVRIVHVAHLQFCPISVSDTVGQVSAGGSHGPIVNF